MVQFSMLRLSVNLLTNILMLLSVTKDYSDTITQEKKIRYSSFSVSVDSMLEMASRCNWVEENRGNIYLSERGRDIVSLPSYGLTVAKARMMLADYIENIRPIWRNRIPSGRREASIFMSKDEKACFSEAGLFSSPPSNDVVKWWDTQAQMIRKEADESHLETGREGEQTTLRYEKKRTGVAPRWVSIESNCVGYDIISQASETDPSMRLIEVKSTTSQIDDAFFFISKNEWNVAKQSKAYFFYIWQINKDLMKLAIVTPEELSHLMPVDQGDGEWQSVKIPYSAVSNSFVDVTI